MSHESNDRSKVQVECIVKLGGSAVTVKDRLETAKFEEIRKTAELVKQWSARADGIGSNVRRCILVHGAGSFGHFQAKEYGVAQGYHGNTDDASISHVKMGFCKTRVSVTKLNQIIVNELVSQGVNGVGVSPCGKWITDDGKVLKSDVDSVRNLLREGYQPVLHGDCVVDRWRGCTILSGDTIIQTLCSEFHPKHVIFLADVDGIYDKPPSQPDAKLLPVVIITQDGQLSIPIAATHQEHDVTGGILKKLRTAVSIAKESKGATNVFVCRINSQAARNVYTKGELLGEAGTEIKMETREDR